MRPMTVREALQIERSPRANAKELDQAGRIMDALVDLRESSLAYAESQRSARRVNTYDAWMEVDARKRDIHAAERRLAALERGEEPQA